MEGERIGSRAQAATDYDETQPLIRSPSIRVKDYLWKLLGLPNHLDGDYVDSDHNSWCRSCRAMNSIGDRCSFSTTDTPLRNCLSRRCGALSINRTSSDRQISIHLSLLLQFDRDKVVRRFLTETCRFLIEHVLLDCTRSFS